MALVVVETSAISIQATAKRVVDGLGLERRKFSSPRLDEIAPLGQCYLIGNLLTRIEMTLPLSPDSRTSVEVHCEVVNGIAVLDTCTPRIPRSHLMKWVNS